MSDIQFICPKCGHNLIVDAAGVGMSVPCPECNEPLVIPSPDEQAAAQADNANAGVDTTSAVNANPGEPLLDKPMVGGQALQRKSAVRGAARVFWMLFKWVAMAVCLIGWLINVAVRWIVVLPTLKVRLARRYRKIGAQAYRNKIDEEKGSEIREQLLAIDRDAQVSGAQPAEGHKSQSGLALFVARGMRRRRMKQLLTTLGKELAEGEAVSDSLSRHIRRAIKTKDVIERIRSTKPKITAAKNFVFGMAMVGVATLIFYDRCNISDMKLEGARASCNSPQLLNSVLPVQSISQPIMASVVAAPPASVDQDVVALFLRHLSKLKDPQLTSAGEDSLTKLFTTNIASMLASVRIKMQVADADEMTIYGEPVGPIEKTYLYKRVCWTDQESIKLLLNLSRGDIIDLGVSYYDRSISAGSQGNALCVYFKSDDKRQLATLPTFCPSMIFASHARSYGVTDDTCPTPEDLKQRLMALPDDIKLRMVSTYLQEWSEDISLQERWWTGVSTSEIVSRKHPRLTSAQNRAVASLNDDICNSLIKSIQVCNIVIDDVVSFLGNAIFGHIDGINGQDIKVGIYDVPEAHPLLHVLQKGQRLRVVGRPGVDITAAHAIPGSVGAVIRYRNPEIALIDK